MSSYGEKRDRRDEIARRDLQAIHDGFQSSGSSSRSGSVNKKKNAIVCVSFLVLLIAAVFLVIIISSG